MWVELTGQLRLVTDDGTVVTSDAFPGRQGRSAFAYLVAHHRPVGRDELADVLWADRLPSGWERSLSVIVSRLRSFLTSRGFQGRDLLVGTGDTYELRLPPGAVLDLDVIPQDLARTQAAFQAGAWEAALVAAVAAAERARRPLLPGLDAAWLDAKRDEMRRWLVHALDLAARADSRLRNTAGAVQCAREAVTLEPLRESGYVTLMKVYLDAGDRAHALRAYDECRAVLADELGVDPSPETHAVYLEALRSEGENRESVIDRGDGDASAARGRGAAIAVGNIPAAVDSFLGRDTDLPVLADVVRRRRVVTLVGVAGVGKSRLALECARRLAPHYPDGVWLCELSALRAEGAVGHAAAATLSLTPAPGTETIVSLADALRARRLLMVLDNCEHLLTEASSLVAALTERCPSVHVLATSREPLGASGEHVWRVQPLALPFPGSHPASPSHRTAALQLFAERAGAVDRGFALTDSTTPAVAEICRRVDGLPLAIELAARRVGVLSPAEIADHLQAPLRLLVSRGPDAQRKRDLRRTIEWSYDLLEGPERRAFAVLAVFAGGFDLAAAAAVCAVSVEEALGAVSALVDKSMVVARPGAPSRYLLYETLRQYALERLDDAGQTRAAAERHGRHFLEVAESCEPRLRSGDEAEAVSVLDRELANLRLAHAWAREHDLERAMRLSAALHWYAFFRHRFESYRWAEQAVETSGADRLPRFAAAAASAANGAWVRGDRDRAMKLAERARSSVPPDDPERRFSAHVLGDVALFEGRLDEAYSWYEEALLLSRVAGDSFHAAIMLGNHGLVRGYQGDLEEALRLAREGLREATSTGSRTGEAWNRYVAGEALSTHDPDRAIEMLEESMAASRRVQNRFVLGVALVTVSSLRSTHGDSKEALRLFSEVIRHWNEAGNWTQQWTALRSVVQLLLRVERYEPAAVLLGAIRKAATAAPAFGADATRLHDAELAIETALGPARMAAAVGRGSVMGDDDAVRFAQGAILEALDEQPTSRRRAF